MTHLVPSGRTCPLSCHQRNAAVGNPLRHLCVAATLTLALGIGPAHSGGFALIEQGASGMGNAYAGAAAVSNDPSTVWFNPAGMLELGHVEFSIAAHLIAVDNKFSDRGTTLNASFGTYDADGNFNLTAAPGADTAEPAGNTVVPNIYYVHRLKPDLAMGVGISVPFGNSTDYGREWKGRYQAVESGVTVIDINPTAAYRINEKLSIGGGISVQLMEATLGNSIDSGATCLGLAGLGLTTQDNCNAEGIGLPGNTATDSYAEVTGDSTEVTFNLGMIFKPAPESKLGVTYRHGSEHDLEGEGNFELNAGLVNVLAQTAAARQALGIVLFENTDALAVANLPPSFSISGTHQIGKFELLGDATWMGWSDFEELRIKFDSGQNDSFNTQSWNDVWRVAGGINYKHSSKLTLRAGAAYDESPVPSVQLRTARIPGNDRTWISMGVGYQVTNAITVDVGYAHLMLDETPIDNASEATGGTTIRGVYDTSINLLSAQLSWTF